MKKFILFITLIAFSFHFIQAQSDDLDEDIQPSCYQKYAKVFEKRGAKKVEDGEHDDVIISFRKGSSADCFLGKVNVENGYIDTDNIYMKFEDDSYEKVERKLKYDDNQISITNGVSRAIITTEDVLINIMFVNKIKPKKKAYMRAPDPDFDL